MELFIGRQPIMDCRQRTAGYELLFRSGMTNAYDGTDEDVATSTVISNTFLTMGADHVLGNRLGFLNFPRRALLDDSALLLPAGKVVIEILETVEPDEQVVAACRMLKQSGYRVALDDVTSTGQADPLLPYADYVKLDFKVLQGGERTRLGKYFQGKGPRLLAEKVETKEDFEAALADGYELFQGYFFARPQILSGHEIPSSKMACLRLLGELQRPELDFLRLEKLIRQDVSLVRKLLCYVNSAAFSIRHRVDSIVRGLVAIGEGNIRKWAAMAALPTLAKDKPGELVNAALVRGRFCELAAGATGKPESAANCFLVGLLSLLDAMIGRPLDELISQLALDPAVSAAIRRTADANPMPVALLDLAIAFERAEFDQIAHGALTAGIEVGTASHLYLQAVGWTNALNQPRLEIH
ncbi:MAG: HDOD domain-containing protein [Bryobacterales bacterium]|nr:HDOD domain-containing protein [Bryobacterales bacterium]